MLFEFKCHLEEWGGFPGGYPGGKESACNAGDPGPSPESGRSPREGNGYPRQYSCLEKLMDRGAGWATVPGIAETQLNYGHFHWKIEGMRLNVDISNIIINIIA